jgi:uncharacterized protein YndB with AHSA1/START domain
MKVTTDGVSSGQPQPLHVSRHFAAPRTLVFKAWSTSDHVKRWFAPAVFTVPQAVVEMRAGGPFEVCMRGPDGVDYWTRGTFAEVSPPDRLVLDLYAVDLENRPLFRAYTEVSFTEEAGGTRLDVIQTYTFVDPAPAAAMVAGASAGWRQTLDKLDVEITRMQGAGRLA